MKCIDYLRTKGVKVIGYVHTKVGYPSITGYRTLAAVKADIDSWKLWYNLDGIFIDEVSNLWYQTWDNQTISRTFYDGVIQYVVSKNAAWLSVLNPGGAYDKALVETHNANTIAVVFESAYTQWHQTNCSTILWTTAQSCWTSGPWC